jgi:hypothetical protein
MVSRYGLRSVRDGLIALVTKSVDEDSWNRYSNFKLNSSSKLAKRSTACALQSPRKSNFKRLFQRVRLRTKF